MIHVIAFILSPLGKVLGIVLAITAAFGATYIAGDSNGAARIQAKWDRAELNAVENARKARIDSERAIFGTDGLPDDKFRRD
jgi:uncharacterized protein YgiM (DUF1202 family)